METIDTPCEIVDAEKMTPGHARYWNRLAANLYRTVDVIDPWRNTLAALRKRYPAGTVVYRASTGGRWGKSSETVTLKG